MFVLQEISCWVPYFCLWPRTSPFILWPCALQLCCIWCRCVDYKLLITYTKCMLYRFFVSLVSFYPLLQNPSYYVSLIFFAFPCFCFSFSSVSTSQWTSGEPVSGGSSCSMPSCTWAACLSSSVSPFSCSAPGTTCHLSTASCEWLKKSLIYI